METFDADWLALREPIDHRSRAESLLAPLCETWRARGWSRVLDLGSGVGSNLRYLASRLPAGQGWVLVDHDPDHLRTLGHAGVPASVRSLRVVPGDLVHEGLAAIPHADLVTASALLDLVSEDWLRRVVDACADAGRGAHFALSYDGEIRWSADDNPDGQGRKTRTTRWSGTRSTPTRPVTKGWGRRWDRRQERWPSGCSGARATRPGFYRARGGLPLPMPRSCAG